MELLALNKDFEPIKYLRCINVQWKRRYYEIGQFSVQICADEFNSDMVYLFTADRPEVGIIQKVQRTETIKGQFIQISGFFLESLLSDKIIYPTFTANGAIGTEVMRMIETYKDDCPIQVSASTLGESVEWSEVGKSLSAVAYEKLQTQQLSLRCAYDYANNVVTAEVWQGLDRTQDQAVNPFVVFADSWGSLSQSTVTTDISAWKNYCVVSGRKIDATDDSDASRIIVNVDASNGGYKREVFLDYKRSQQKDQTEAQYKEILKQAGLEQLQKYLPITNIEVNAKANLYRKDFDLGDLVDVIINDMGITMQARIIACDETVKNNSTTVKITLGDKILTTAEKVRFRG